MSRITAGVAAFIAIATAATSAAAQWESPTFFSPRTGDELGAYLLFPDRGDLGIAGIWRQTGRIDLGVRAGFIDFGEDTGILVGAELFGPLNLFGPGTPVSAGWMSGVGAVFNGDVTFLRIPLGISIGPTLASESLRITPYVHPRVAFDLVAYDVGDEEETDSELNVDVDIGADLALGRSLILKFGATFGESEVIGIGLAWRTPRGVAVR